MQGLNYYYNQAYDSKGRRRGRRWRGDEESAAIEMDGGGDGGGFKRGSSSNQGDDGEGSRFVVEFPAPRLTGKLVAVLLLAGLTWGMGAAVWGSLEAAVLGRQTVVVRREGDETPGGDAPQDTGNESKVVITTNLTTCREVVDHLGKDNVTSGIYVIQIGGVPRHVYCDMHDGGGWTVFQRRGRQHMNPADYFLRDWAEYRDGFGDPRKEYWLGLEAIHQLTRHGEVEMRITMGGYSDPRHLQLNGFSLDGEQDGFALKYSSFTSLQLGRGLPASGCKFSTYDADNDASPDRNCALEHSSGWWFGNCTGGSGSDLNGLATHDGIFWEVSGYGGKNYFRQTEMKLRRRPTTS